MNFSIRSLAVTKLFALLIALVLPLAVQADSHLEKTIGEDISQTMDRLLSLLEENEAQYSKDADLFYHDLDKELSKVIDFKRIALKVMGKHGRKASKEQRQEFLTVFKRSLYNAYAATLLESKNVTAEVLSVTVNNRNSKKAKVELNINAGTGTKYDIVYALHQGKDQVYRIENIIVMGINMGLAFRDHFQQQMRAHQGNITAVIKNWSSKGVA